MLNSVEKQSPMITCKYEQDVDKMSIITIDIVWTSSPLRRFINYGQVTQGTFEKYRQVVLLCETGSPHQDI